MDRRARTWALAFFLAIGAAGAPGAANAGDPPAGRSEARQAAQRATEAFKENRFQDALDELGRAEALVHAPTHVLMMARCRLALGALVEARRLYREVVAEEVAKGAPPAFARAHDDAVAELALLEPRIPELVVKVAPAGATGVSV